MRITLLIVALLIAPAGVLAQQQLPATLTARSVLVLKRPIAGEPIQGFSSVSAREDGSYWVMADTGHDAGRRREDVHVVFHHIHIDWLTGRSRLLSSEPLYDPDRKMPFPIVNEDTRERRLTAADVNVDALRVVEYDAWLVDDFGPHLIHADSHGRVLAVYPARLEGRPLDNGAHRHAFGGVGASRDARFVYAVLEAPLPSEAQGGWESLPDGRPYVRILEFEPRARQWTGRALRYALEAGGHSIGDLTLLDARTALVVERGPQFRRIYKVQFDGLEARKLAFVELREIDMATVEGLDVVEPGYIVLTSGERMEFVLLRSPELLAAP